MRTAAAEEAEEAADRDRDNLTESERAIKR